MADIRISQLTNKVTPTGTDEIEIQETADGDSYKVALNSFVPLVRPWRVMTSSNQTSVTPSTDTDIVNITSVNGAGTFTINNPTGTPSPWQDLIIYLKHTGSNSVAWGDAYVGGQNALYTAITSAKMMYMHFVYDPTAGKWYQRYRGTQA